MTESMDGLSISSTSEVSSIKPRLPQGPFTPQLILHGGAGAITRERLPPDLYKRYHRSLLSYVKSTHALLTDVENPASALDAACYAVSLMEDNPLFNCGRGSVFNVNGNIEMEASVAVTSVESGEDEGKSESAPGSIKRSAAVSMVRNTRHPIRLAREVLLMADEDGGLGGTAEMHGHLAGRDVEEWGWKEKGLEKKPDDWFWTKWRWEEHRRGLGKHSEEDPLSYVAEVASQGTVGCVCLDTWGNLAVATSTGGLTNKRSGRIGDTPTIGAGFYAESWSEKTSEAIAISTAATEFLQVGLQQVLGEIQTVSRRSWIARCLMPSGDPAYLPSQEKASIHQSLMHQEGRGSEGKNKATRRRAVAMSGTGNGDSFLRTSATRTTAAICRFSGQSLAEATTAVAGPGGELQRSAGDRWQQTGEGEGGIIAIEAIHSKGVHDANVVFDFNCGGMWRAWYDKGKPRVMVFKDEY